MFVDGGKRSKLREVRWTPGLDAIEVWFGKAAGRQLEGKILWLKAAAVGGDGKTLAWNCAGHDANPAERDMPPEYLPASFRQSPKAIAGNLHTGMRRYES